MRIQCPLAPYSQPSYCRRDKSAGNSVYAAHAAFDHRSAGLGSRGDRGIYLALFASRANNQPTLCTIKRYAEHLVSFRLDRFTTLYVVRSAQRCGLKNKSSIPILMYHSVSYDSEAAVHPYYHTTTSPSAFMQQMQCLHDYGYQAINIADAVRLFHVRGSLASRVVLTFDDGYADFYRYAFPILKRYGFAATVFLPTAYIGTSRLHFKNKECLTWSEVRELRRAGVSFGSHTVTHPRLTTLDAHGVRDEIVNSKQTIEDNLGESIDTFAYPFAFPETNGCFVRMLRDTLIQAGYRQGVSTRIGTAHRHEDQYFLRRLPVNSHDDISLFSAKLQGAYNWLHTIQYGSKLLRRREC